MQCPGYSKNNKIINKHELTNDSYIHVPLINQAQGLMWDTAWVQSCQFTCQWPERKALGQ